MSPTLRAALAFAAAALLALLVAPLLAVVVVIAVVTAVAVDLVRARRPPAVEREVPVVLARGVASDLRITTTAPGSSRVRVRQPRIPDLPVDPPEGDDVLDAVVRPRRRGRHELPSVATRTEGPLGLGSWYRHDETTASVRVFPDLPAARRLALAVRQGRFREPGRLTRGPLGLGTDFESIRDYSPDDDIRQVNWRASARTGRPMSNQFRVEQDRDVILVLDTGRLMAAPLGDRTRLDAAIDALAAVALVADEVGDRCGAVAFDRDVRTLVGPARRNGSAVIQATFELEPSPADADYERAFREIGGSKRAFVLVLTDLVEEVAARSLLRAVPVLARRHAVVVAGATDPDLRQAVTADPHDTDDLARAAVALAVLDERNHVAALLRHAGAEVIEAPPERLATACVGAYLRAKARARL